MNYRPEIDGLRAVSVIAVLLFHASFEGPSGQALFTGGFIGVDVFFVISGYLITSIVAVQIRAGTFSFADFYLRRCARLLPTLLTVTVLACAAGWFALLPGETLDFAKTVLAALLFCSNMLFSQELAYNAQPNLLKPLLHTWSLSVEEQFYMLWPALLFALSAYGGKRFIAMGVIAATALSFLAAVLATPTNPNESFYWLPTRLWELAAGGIMALAAANRPQPAPNPATAAAGLSGLVMLIFSFRLFGDDTPHPSFPTLLPVIATMAIIRFSAGAGPVSAVLSNRVMVGIGIRSYTLYIVHFPAFAIARNLELLNGNLAKALVTAIAVALSMAIYSRIERPLRDIGNRRGMAVYCAVLLAVLAGYVAATFWTSGNLWRGQALAHAGPAESPQSGAVEFEDSVLKFINIGDSHAAALIPAFREAAQAGRFDMVNVIGAGTMPIKGLYFLTDGAAQARYGDGAIRKLDALIDEEIRRGVSQGKNVVLVLSGRIPLYLGQGRPQNPVTGYREHGNNHVFTADGRTQASPQVVLTLLREQVRHWNGEGAGVILVHPVPEMANNVPKRLFQAAVIGRLIPGTAPGGIDLPLAAHKARAGQTNALMDAVIGERVAHVHPQAVLCLPENAICPAVRDGMMLYRDSNHVSAEGARLLANEIIRAGAGL